MSVVVVGREGLTSPFRTSEDYLAMRDHALQSQHLVQVWILASSAAKFSKLGILNDRSIHSLLSPILYFQLLGYSVVGPTDPLAWTSTVADSV